MRMGRGPAIADGGVSLRLCHRRSTLLCRRKVPAAFLRTLASAVAARVRGRAGAWGTGAPDLGGRRQPLRADEFTPLIVKDGREQARYGVITATWAPSGGLGPSGDRAPGEGTGESVNFDARIKSSGSG
ncbi:hypothetical protein Kisp02_02300 [Kineosporia sp. NBRC 101731]|nr:hypothetical protein Kisp02_02300 [Kineosporia sp. NBRC 101731]